MLAMIALRGNRTIAAPAGWIPLLRTNNSSGSNISQEVFVKVATSSEPASFTFRFSSSERHAAVILTYRGVDTGSPVDARGGQSNSGSSSNVTSPSITTTLASTRIVGFFGIANGNATFSAPSGSTARLIEASSAGPNGVAVLAADYANSTASATGAKVAVATSATQSVGQQVALRPVGGLIACYSFEQGSWNGTPGEVIEGSSAFNGVRLGAAQTITGGKLSRGANFPLNTSSATRDAVQTPIHMDNHVGNAGTISFWYKSNANWNSGVRRQLLDASSATASPQRYFYLEIDSSGDLEFGLEDSADTDYVNETIGYSGFRAGTWVHVAITWQLPDGAMQIFVNGALARSVSINTSNRNLSAPNVLHIGDNSSTYVPNSSGNSANGVIDEVRVYNTVRTGAQISVDFASTTPCGGSTTRFSIDAGATTASTCAPKSITLTAITGGGVTDTGYTGTINLSTSTGTGDWSVVSGGGVLANGSADDGLATYTFSALDNGLITLGLSHQLAQSVSVTAADTTAPSTAVTSSAIAFSSNAFVFTEDPASRIAGADVVVAGRAHDYQVALYRRDASSGNQCAIATAYSGNKALKAWLTRDIDDPAGTAPSISTASLGNSQPIADNLNLTFTNGVASFNLLTSDVGKYVINLRDDSTVGLSGAITGSTNTATARLFALAVSAVRRGTTQNPNTSTASGTVFTQAGESFQASVGGYLHSSAADANDDGVPDGNATLAQTTGAGPAPRFAFATTLSAAAPFAPTTGVPGTLSNGALGAGNYAGGVAMPTTLSYSEVGSFSLAASVNNYLNSASVNLSGMVFSASGVQNAVTGRFTPHDFGVSLNAPIFSPGCASNTAFTYIGQAFSFGTAPVISVKARNKAGATTRNYTGSWWKINHTSLTGRAYTAVSGSLDTSGLPATTTDPVIVDLGGAMSGEGTLTFSSGSGLLFTRAAPVSPFNADIALALNVTDSDGVSYASNPARFAAASTGNGIAFSGTGGGKSMRWGRLKLSNALGSEFADLALPIETQYYTSVSFVTNADDGCTSLANTALIFGNFQRNLNACETYVSASPIVLNAGKARVQLRKPGGGNAGSVDVKPGLASIDSGVGCVSAAVTVASGASLSYLRSNWDPAAPAAFDKNPSGRAVFGVPNVPREIIFHRENY